jgi:hypothetical protein
MAAPKKTTYINTEITWAEEQLVSWKAYVDQNPMHELNYRIEYNQNVTKQKQHYLYCHFSLNCEMPFYVGIGTHSKYKNFNRAKSSSGRNISWKEKSKNKYLIVICNESDNYEYIKSLEKEFISLYGLENLTNITKGGSGCKGYKHTTEHILKLKENYKLGKCALKDRIISKKERNVKSFLYSGEGNPNYNKLGFKSTRGKIVEKLNLNGNVIFSYGSLRDAARKENTNHTSIRSAILNNTIFMNFKWKYKYGN